MASVTSLGIHRPSAIPFLVAEGILPIEPSPSLYECQTLPSRPLSSDDEEEELLTTEHCVVWSRGRVVQRLFRFDVETEPVRHALFTHFDRREKPGRRKLHGSPDHCRYGGAKAHDGLNDGLNDGLGLNIDSHAAERPELDLSFDIPSQSDTTTDAGSFRGEGNEYSTTGMSSSGRALVVVLKTQAHVFFLSGTTHVVHLPFEVDKAFSLPLGLLLQRQITKNEASSTPILPSVPQNSFAFEGPASTGVIRSFQDYPVLNETQEKSDLNLPFLPMLNNVRKQASEFSAGAGPPRLYCLIDPLLKISVAVTRGKDEYTRRPWQRHGKGALRSDTLDPLENLLHVSEPIHLGQQGSFSGLALPTLLAVSQNVQSREYSVWSVEYVDHRPSASAHCRIASKYGRRNDRRRTSYGIGTSNGANTPVARGPTAGRESFGMARSRSSAARDMLSDESFNDVEDNLASHLDSALENPSAPAKSSRRISSLLARADLSSMKDKIAYSDLAGSYTGSLVTRRGPSSGAPAVKPSSATDIGSSLARTKHLGGIRIEPPTVNESYAANSELDSDEETMSGNSKDTSLGQQFLGPRGDMIFTKVQSVSAGKIDKVKSSDGTRIFALKPPAHVDRTGHEKADTFLCITDQSSASLIVISLRQISYSGVRIDKGSVDTHVSSKGSRRCGFQVTSCTRRTDVIDASGISDVHCYRLLILSRSPSGQHELELQDPWNGSCAIRLPSIFFLYNPYQVVNTISRRQKREGGFKRILSQGPQAPIGLRQGGGGGVAVVIDAEGTKHRVKIQLQPRNQLLRTMIILCDSILPVTDGNKEPTLNEWWKAMTWLSAKEDVDGDREWTAFVIVLFSIAAGFVEDRRAEATTRQRKRKAGLLRSSSGANTNMESWEAMLIEESGTPRSTPGWMHGEAWAWTTQQAKVSAPAQAGVSRKVRISRPSSAPTLPSPKKSTYLIDCMSLARDFRNAASEAGNTRESYLARTPFKNDHSQRTALATILVGLHLLREELKLNILTHSAVHDLTPILAQIGGWLGWPSWGFKDSAFYALESVNMEAWLFEDTSPQAVGRVVQEQPFHPPSILHYVEAASLQPPVTSFVSLLHVLGHRYTNKELMDSNDRWAKHLVDLTPRTIAMNALLTTGPQQSMEAKIAELTSWRWDLSTLETLPESIAVPFRTAISFCQAQPSAASDKAVLAMLGRDDICLQKEESHATQPQVSTALISQDGAVRDVHVICASTLEVETVGSYDGTVAADRQSTTSMVFKDDQRFAEATKLLHPLHAPTVKCVPEPEWSERELLEAQQELAKTIALRTLAVSPGRSCLFFSARLPLLTERFPIHGFALSCIMKPSGTTVTADKAAYTEEKVSWAFFHAGVEAGLSISKSAKGINASWILFNKPQELKNRHAGFLLALGLNGHLKSIVKWVAFKYLTPKHTMTSIGLLLGLAASYLGTMDTLITRLLSVHVTRMLPPGAADLNLSPLTQTSGIMGIGLLYCGTQHRRMSEIMLSEMENGDEDESSSPQDSLRDEGYRLAAGFALGYINLGRGNDLKGLHDMQIVERLLALAIGTKKVTMVHILDKATAAATVAIALIFMKTHNEGLARKIDIPDTLHQFDYVRPDVFLLRTLARHLIMWNDISPTSGWMKKQLPMTYQYKAKLTMLRSLNSDDMPFFNIIAGLCLAVGLRYAGTGAIEVRNLLCHYLDQFIRVCQLSVLNYDGKLARITVRNCQDVVALASACVVAGTGDLHVFRRLRALHGRTEAETPYGSHLATHLAMGILFLGGGTYSFGTSDIAVASLLCAFYPLFPTTVLDNKSHLQAFRHFWVLAAEARCLVVHDIDTRRLISIPVTVSLKSGSSMCLTAPCLVPELNSIAKIQTNDPDYGIVTLDLAGNPYDYEAFRQHRGIWVRRRAAHDAHLSIFSTTMQALNEVQSSHTVNRHIFEWIFKLKTFRDFDSAEQALVLPADLASIAYKSTRGTVVDDRLVLETTCMNSGKSERLWNLRILFAWADALGRSGDQWGWIGKEVVERLRTRLTMKKMQR